MLDQKVKSLTAFFLPKIDFVYEKLLNKLGSIEEIGTFYAPALS